MYRLTYNLVDYIHYTQWKKAFLLSAKPMSLDHREVDLAL